MVQTSIFDLLQTLDAPQAKDLQKWLTLMFPKATDRSSLQLAVQLEKLFEMAVYENQIDTVHLLLQQGFSPNIRGDWGTTPLMWANCLNYPKIALLLKSYGANQHAKSFSNKVAKDFCSPLYQNLPEYQSILIRYKEIHAQVEAGYLKPLDATAAATDSSSQKTSRPRQIDNGKGVDELFKTINKSSRTTRELKFTVM